MMGISRCPQLATICHLHPSLLLVGADDEGPAGAWLDIVNVENPVVAVQTDVVDVVAVVHIVAWADHRRLNQQVIVRTKWMKLTGHHYDE